MGPHHHLHEARSMVAKKVEEDQTSRVPGALTLVFAMIVVLAMAFVVKVYILPIYFSNKKKSKTQRQLKEEKYMN